jgi:hypothetical protein
VAACRNRHRTLGHRRRTPFFSAALKRNDRRHAVAKAAANPGKWYKAGEAIEVMEQLEFCHRKSMAGFPLEGKNEFPGFYLLSGASEQESYPLKNAMSRK